MRKKEDLEVYKRMKLRIFRDFRIPLTRADKQHMSDLMDKPSVDRFCVTIFMRHCDD